jgi:hypothetical protein
MGEQHLPLTVSDPGSAGSRFFKTGSLAEAHGVSPKVFSSAVIKLMSRQILPCVIGELVIVSTSAADLSRDDLENIFYASLIEMTELFSFFCGDTC